MRSDADISGKKFGRLTAIQPSCKETKSHDKYWEFRCDCGKMMTAFRGSVVNGKTKSCGCLQAEKSCKQGKKNVKHGMQPLRLYHIWNNMKQRCKSPKHHAYKDYGMRGISVCEEWKNDFGAFREWALSNGYTESLTIDRIDVNGDYEPANCRWVDMNGQMQNQRKTIKVDGVSLKKWCRDHGVNYANVTAYKYRHPEMDIEDVLAIYMSKQA